MDGISVIICCYNSQLRIIETLTYLTKQKNTSAFPWEVIIVNNNCSDNTVGVVNDFIASIAGQGFDFSVVDEKNPGLQHAREKGVAVSKYDYILFCDDDNWLEENYLNYAYTFLHAHDEVGILGGEGIAVFEGEEPEWYKKHKSVYATGKQLEQTGYMPKGRYLWGAGMIIKKEIFRKLTAMNFQTLLKDRTGASLSSHGDTEIAIAASLLGYKSYYDEKLVFSHYLTKSRMTWSYLLKLYKGVGGSILPVRKFTLVDLKAENPSWKKEFSRIFKQTFLKPKAFILGSLTFMEGNKYAPGHVFRIAELKSIYANKDKIDYYALYKKAFKDII